mgnify:FL=1
MKNETPPFFSTYKDIQSDVLFYIQCREVMTMAMPRKEFDKEQFEKLCQMFCTEKEICSWFGTSDKTLSNWCKRTYGKTFSETYKEKREGGKASLRRIQLHLAEKSAAMAIFLGKNYLGQSDADTHKQAVDKANLELRKREVEAKEF